MGEDYLVDSCSQCQLCLFTDFTRPDDQTDPVGLVEGQTHVGLELKNNLVNRDLERKENTARILFQLGFFLRFYSNELHSRSTIKTGRQFFCWIIF